MTSSELAELSKKMKVLQKKGSILIFLAFQTLGTHKLRRSQLSTALGASISKGKGGLLSDKTLDRRLEELTKKGFMESERDLSPYPPAKYYKLTEKGNKILNTLCRMIKEL